MYRKRDAGLIVSSRTRPKRRGVITEVSEPVSVGPFILWQHITVQWDGEDFTDRVFRDEIRPLTIKPPAEVSRQLSETIQQIKAHRQK